jgi:hypothetical protein
VKGGGGAKEVGAQCGRSETCQGWTEGGSRGLRAAAVESGGWKSTREALNNCLQRLARPMSGVAARVVRSALACAALTGGRDILCLVMRACTDLTTTTSTCCMSQTMIP